MFKVVLLAVFHVRFVSTGLRERCPITSDPASLPATCRPRKVADVIWYPDAGSLGSRHCRKPARVTALTLRPRWRPVASLTVFEFEDSMYTSSTSSALRTRAYAGCPDARTTNPRNRSARTFRNQPNIVVFLMYAFLFLVFDVFKIVLAYLDRMAMFT
jgi:hypothetical protein